VKLRLVTLLAGIGERLRPLTTRIPKALIEFSGVTITQMCLGTFSELGISEAALVVGHFGDKIRARIGDDYQGIKITYIYNPLYLTTGGAYSLWLAQRFFKGKPAIIMDGDQLIDKRLLRKLVTAPYENCLLVDQSWQPPYSEETLVIGKNGIAKSLYWNPATKGLPQHIIGEAVIAIKLGAEATASLSHIMGDNMGEHIESLTKVLGKHETHYISTDGLPWIEIDSTDDLKRAQGIFAQMVKYGI